MSRDLTERVTIQKEVRTYFEGGASTVTWQNVGTEWAEVQYLFGPSREYYGQEKKQQMSIYEVTTRQDVTITNENRLLWNGKILVVEDEGDLTGRDRRKRLRCRLENTR